MFPPGIEPGTLRVWGARDNRYTTETQLIWVYDFKAYIMYPLYCSLAACKGDQIWDSTSTSLEPGIYSLAPLWMNVTKSLALCRNSLKVQLLFAKEYLAALPDEELRAGHTIQVVPILFTQGVNEMQNFASKHE